MEQKETKPAGATTPVVTASQPVVQEQTAPTIAEGAKKPTETPKQAPVVVVSEAETERQRIREIDALGIVGYDDLVADAKYTHPITAEALAAKVLKAQNDKQAQLGESYAKNATTIKVKPSVAAVSDDTAETEKAASFMVGKINERRGK